jgi:hypothetical protein
VVYLSCFQLYLAHYCLHDLLRVIRIERMPKLSSPSRNNLSNGGHPSLIWIRVSISSCVPSPGSWRGVTYCRATMGCVGSFRINVPTRMAILYESTGRISHKADKDFQHNFNKNIYSIVEKSQRFYSNDSSSWVLPQIRILSGISSVASSMPCAKLKKAKAWAAKSVPLFQLLLIS